MLGALNVCVSGRQLRVTPNFRPIIARDRRQTGCPTNRAITGHCYQLDWYLPRNLYSQHQLLAGAPLKLFFFFFIHDDVTLTPFNSIISLRFFVSRPDNGCRMTGGNMLLDGISSLETICWEIMKENCFAEGIIRLRINWWQYY